MRKLMTVAALSLAGLGLLTARATDTQTDRPAVAAPSDAPEFEGLTFPYRKALLGFARSSGVVATRPVDVGDYVQAGQLIARLVSETETAAVQITRLRTTSEHELLAARMSEEQALLEFNRVDSLFKRDLATEWEHKKARVEHEIARLRTQYATFQRSLVALELTRDEAALKDREIRAPWPGVISETHKEAGESVQDSMAIVELAQYDPLRVELNLPEKFEVKLLQKALVVIDGVTTTGKVNVVHPQVQAASRTYRVHLEVPNPDQKLKAGKLARVRFLNEFAPPTAAPDAKTER